MICPSCGKETTGETCKSCGAVLAKTEEAGTLKTETVETGTVYTPESYKKCCPKCGSDKIRYSREKVSGTSHFDSYKWTSRTTTGSSRSKYQYKTLALCQNCGHSWYPQNGQRGGCLIAIFGLLIFPFKFSAYFYKNDEYKLPKGVKAAILAVAWIIILFLAYCIFC